MKINWLPFRNALIRSCWMLSLTASVFLSAEDAGAQSNLRPLRIGLPQSIFHMQFALMSDWQQYLQNRLHRPVEFVSSRKFGDSIVQLHMEKLDYAWVTDYPNAAIGFKVRLLAVPLYHGRPFFTSYLIVPASDTKTTSLFQLKGAVFAFADPGSNGHVEQRYALFDAGEDPKRFFQKVFFTHAHQESIQSVILGLANAAEVDSYVWDTLVQAHPEIAQQTRVVAHSQEYGAPPLVANHFVTKAEFTEMQNVLIGMAQDAEGASILKQMSLDGFVPGDPKLYERLGQMKKALGEE